MGWAYRSGYRSTRLVHDEINQVTPASKETLEKLNKALEGIGDAHRASLERLYKVDQRGYWGEWSANNCISKLGGK